MNLDEIHFLLLGQISMISVLPGSSFKLSLFKYVTMIRISLMMMFLPFVSIAQKSDFSGVWVLKEKKSLNGPDYENGVPKII